MAIDGGLDVPSSSQCSSTSQRRQSALIKQCENLHVLPPWSKMPVYTVMYEGQSTSYHSRNPPRDQRIFDQQVPLTHTKHKASRYAELSHTQAITDRKPFSILYRHVHMFDQALCLLIWSVTVYGSMYTHSIMSLCKPWQELWSLQTSDVCNPERLGIEAGQSGLCTYFVAWQMVQSKFFQVNLYNRLLGHAYDFLATPCLTHLHRAASWCV